MKFYKNFMIPETVTEALVLVLGSPINRNVIIQSKHQSIQLSFPIEDLMLRGDEAFKEMHEIAMKCIDGLDEMY